MKAGDRVRITAAVLGWVDGEITWIGVPTDLPELPGFEQGQVTMILGELRVTRIALIEHPHVRLGHVIFVALEIAGGEWRDLGHRRIWVVPLK